MRTVWIAFRCMKFPQCEMKVMKSFWDLFVAVHSLRSFLHRRELHSDCFCSFNQPFSFINKCGWLEFWNERSNEFIEIQLFNIGLPLDFHQFKFWLWIFDRASIFSSEKCRNFILRYSMKKKANLNEVGTNHVNYRRWFMAETIVSVRFYYVTDFRLYNLSLSGD